MPVPYMIVDDEALGRENLRLAMAAYADWRLVAECASTSAARTVLANCEPDLIFLDIHMPGESGLALAREISRMREPPLIVFFTSHSGHAVDAFEVHALDYLLKPLNDERLAQALERARRMLQLRQREAYGAALRDFLRSGETPHATHLNVRSIGRIEQIPAADILWAESAGNYVQLHLASRSVLHRVTLAHLESLLGTEAYIRVHRGTIVRRDQLGTLAADRDATYSLTLRCGSTVRVSERHVAAVKACMQ